MDDTAQKTISTVSTAADDDFSMEFFKDAVRYVKIVFLRCCFDLITLKTCEIRTSSFSSLAKIII